MSKVVVKKYIVRNRQFVIVENEEGFYLAIEDKYINADGKLNTKLNGIQMCASKELNECLGRCKDHVEIDCLISHGYSKAEAFAKMFNMEDRLDGLKEVFGEIEKGVKNGKVQTNYRMARF